MSNVNLPPHIVEEIEEVFGPAGVQEAVEKLNDSVYALRGLEDDVLQYFSLHPRAPMALYAPLYNTSVAIH